MASWAFRCTRYTLDVLSKFVKAKVRLHNLDALRDDMSVIFVLNHFTRLETILFPYHLYKHKGLEAWSLAADDLFRGRIGAAAMRLFGTVSTRDPDRDRVIVHSLLAGDHPWIIFPEGAMIKDKKLIDARGRFEVFSHGTRRPPHTGPAVLALRSEYVRRKIACLNESHSHNGMERVLDRFGLDSVEQALGRKTVIIPVNITYYPIRAYGNVFTKIVNRVRRELSDRANEELLVEGTILAKDSDVDIALGEPIDVGEYLETPRFKKLVQCDEDDVDRLEDDPKSVFNDVARSIMRRYMKDIYDLTTINEDHIFATLVRHQGKRRMTERGYRNRIFLCAREAMGLAHRRIHDRLSANYHKILYEEPMPSFDEFLELCREEKVLELTGETYSRNPLVDRGKSGFHAVRAKEVTYVIANEVEPLTDIVSIVKKQAAASRARVSRTIRDQFLKEDEKLFERDFARFNRGKLGRSPDVGRPFLLKPPRVKAGIVLVHGYLAAPLEVRAMADYFYHHGYAVYGVRLKGHGTSPEDLASTPWEEWYESLNRGYAVIKSLTDRIVLGGHSMGGGLALLAAGRKRHYVQAVFSINAPLELRHYAAHLVSSVVSLNTLMRRIKARRGKFDFLKHQPENPQINYKSNPLTGLKEMGELMDEMEKSLIDISAPTLIVQGSRDPVVDPESARLIFSQVGTRLKEMTVFEREHHGIINGEGAQDVYSRIEQFLEWSKEAKASAPPKPAKRANRGSPDRR